MKLKLFGVAFVIIFIVCFTGLENSCLQADITVSLLLTETQVTSNVGSQAYPDVFGDVIVWQDDRNGNWDIYMYAPMVNMWSPEIRITTNQGNQINPAIYNNTIVYQDDSTGNWEICMYNITTGVETQITNNPSAQTVPAVYGDYIVWQDDRNIYWSEYNTYYTGRDIYLYNITAQTEHRITTTENNHNPSISGNRIAYQKSIREPYGTLVFTNSYVYYFDLSTEQEFRLKYVDDDTSIYTTAIQESTIVWGTHWYEYHYSGIEEDWNVEMKDISTGANWAAYVGTDQLNPDIGGGGAYKYIVYEDTRDQNYEIYLYMLLSNEEVRVTNNFATQSNPAIYSGKTNGWSYNRIVFMDDRNGNWDIYQIDFGWVAVSPGNFLAPKPLTPSLAIHKLQNLRSDLADSSKFSTSDFAGANDKVKENRRNALLNQFDSTIASFQDAANTEDLKLRRMYCQDAIDQLKEIQSKTDGCTLRGTTDVSGSRFTPDWIVCREGSSAQIYLYQGTKSLITQLQTLLENIN